MSIPISGILLDPYGNVARFADIKFVTVKGALDVIESSSAVFRTDENGAYSIDVQFGRFAVLMRFNGNNGAYEKIQTISVNSDTIATTLGELLEYTEPLTPGEILIVQQLVQQATDAKDDAEAAALAALLSEQNAAASAVAALASENAAANSVALLAPVPLNGGVWAAGQEFTAYNQYMIFSGEAYSPRQETTLPYVVGATPDLGFVYQVKLNSLQALSGLDEPSDLDGSYHRFTSVADVESGDYNVGDKLTLSDRSGDHFDVVSDVGVLIDGYDKINGVGKAAVRRFVGDRYLSGQPAGIGLGFMQHLNANQRDVFMLVQSDSTADAAGEWVRRVSEWLVTEFTTHTVNYYLWDELANDFAAPIVLGSGTGANTLHIYNGSKGGASSEYFMYKQRPNAFAGREFDLILYSYGHNQGDWDIGKLIGKLSWSVCQLIRDQQKAEIVMMLQNLWGDQQERSSRHSDASIKVAAMYGLPVIDCRSPFLWKNINGDINDWLADGLHPNSQGSQVWARVVQQALLNPIKQHVSHLNTLAQKSVSPIRNSFFTHWDWDSGSPLGDYSKINVTAIRENSIFETGLSSVRLEGTTAADGYYRVPLSHLLQEMDLRNGVTFMARVYYSNQWITLNQSTLLFTTNLSGGQTETSQGRDSSPILQDGWNWKLVYMSAEKIIGATQMNCDITVGRSGEVMYLDRVHVVEGMLPQGLLFNKQEVFDEYYDSFNVGSNANNTITVTGDSISHDSSTAGTPTFYINCYGLIPGEQYTVKWAYNGPVTTSGGILFRSGLNDSGAVIKQQNNITLGEFTFRPTTTSGSFQVFNSSGNLPYSIDSVTIVKGVG